MLQTNPREISRNFEIAFLKTLMKCKHIDVDHAKCLFSYFLEKFQYKGGDKVENEKPVTIQNERETEGIKAIKDAADTAMNALDSEFEDIEKKFITRPDHRQQWDMRNYVSEG